MNTYIKTTAASVALMAVLLTPVSPGAAISGTNQQGPSIAYAAETGQQLADGVYSLDYTFLKHNTDQVSVMQDYVVTPGKLIVQNGKLTVEVTLKQSKEIIGFKIDTGNGLATPETVVENEQANTRVVSFEVDDLSEKLEGWVKIYWQVSPTFLYDHEYKVELQLDKDSIEEWQGEQEPTEPVDPEPEQPTQPEQPAPGPEEPVAPSPDFTDLTNHWAKSAIEQAVSKGIVNGYEDNTFRPNGQVSRAEFVAMLGRALPANEEPSTYASFSDEQDIPAWVEPYLAPIAGAGIIGGYEDGTFRPAQRITRAELAVIIVRAHQLQTTPDATLTFADAADIPDWARAEVAAAHAAGLMNGREGNVFAPHVLATRAEAVSLILSLSN
ncbi:S-layer homology domain-containing protein [Paenibacillus sp. 1P07SE]|uniref:S-layer homology domain-containing protein n=1 Tax=Paenibacillus sp. 1P07SE TaxID=3132209 RepID=UPI0039A451C0